ncbi:hypothetical protein CDAR_252231 [Caerostris darwini]|uniref:Uncharacterized protein n=1 Tax=Caerostris darwini TaxID=1538125 RepID=A0AAV4QCV0_9ARAC|nr:hypothetical protein CDAR_252231 [Caerostris darwini]
MTLGGVTLCIELPNIERSIHNLPKDTEPENHHFYSGREVYANENSDDKIKTFHFCKSFLLMCRPIASHFNSHHASPVNESKTAELCSSDSYEK